MYVLQACVLQYGLNIKLQSIGYDYHMDFVCIAIVYELLEALAGPAQTLQALAHLLQRGVESVEGELLVFPEGHIALAKGLTVGLPRITLGYFLAAEALEERLRHVLRGGRAVKVDQDHDFGGAHAFRSPSR